MAHKYSSILLFSGGMDSFCAWFLRGKPLCVHVFGHSRYSGKELDAIQTLCNRHTDLRVEYWDMRSLKQFEEEDSNIQMRNAHFALIAAHFGDHILLPCQRGEQSIPDRSPQFFQEISELISHLQGRKIVVDPVFPEMTKQDVVALYLSTGGDPESLHFTYSCSSPSPGRCGRCKMCLRTAIALDYNGILPPNFFKGEIWKWVGTQDFYKRIQKGEVEERRAQQSLRVLQKHVKTDVQTY